MTEREKKLAIILACLMIFGVGGGGFWYGFYVPYSEASNQVATLGEEIDKLENDIENYQAKNQQNFTRHPRIKEWKNLSFPLPEKQQSDVVKAHNAALKLDYSAILSDLAVRNGFKPGTFTVKPMERADIRNVPTLEGKKPVYEVFQFEVDGKSKLEDIAAFLHQLHQLPLLHHVPYLKVERPKNQTSKGDLKFNMHIEALMVSEATKKPRLDVEKLLATLKTSGGKSPVLASKPRDYGLFASNNPFFPPDPPPAPVKKPDPPPVVVKGPSEDAEEVLSAVKLTTITGDGRRWEAYLYDQNRGGRETKIKPSAAWSEFSIKDKYENEILKAKLLHIDPAFILFQSEDKIYMMRCGETLFPAVANPMDSDALKSLGLEKFVPAKPKPEPSKDKKGEKGKESSSSKLRGN